MLILDLSNAMCRMSPVASTCPDEHKAGRMDGWMGGRKESWMDGWKDGRRDGLENWGSSHRDYCTSNPFHVYKFPTDVLYVLLPQGNTVSSATHLCMEHRVSDQPTPIRNPFPKSELLFHTSNAPPKMHISSTM